MLHFEASIRKLFAPISSCLLPLVTFPLDLTKTRLQIQGETAVCRYENAAKRTIPYRGMVRTAAGIIKEEGVLKLWQGATPAVYRHIGLIYAALFISVYYNKRTLPMSSF